MAKGAFVVAMVLLIPFLVGMLVIQGGAEKRLQALGVEPHPSIRHVIGAAAGVGRTPIWLFRLETEPEGPLVFYLDPETRPGWEIDAHVPGQSVFLQRQGRRVWITFTGGPERPLLTYQYRPADHPER